MSHEQKTRDGDPKQPVSSTDAQKNAAELNKNVIKALHEQSSMAKTPNEYSTVLNPKLDKKVTKRMCRMFFPSSGRMGFDMVKVSEELPPVETIRKMILYETQLRLSDEMQNLMDLYSHDEDSVT